MKIINLIPGSPEWVKSRSASKAAAMMGFDKKTSRSELMHMMFTGIGKEFSDWQQRNLLDKGNATEVGARVLAEGIIGEGLASQCFATDDDYLTSAPDGITFSGNAGFEAKTWNEALAASVRANNIPDTHWPQLEQQIFVCGLDYVLFMVSDGTSERTVSMEYRAVPGRMESIINGWHQFDKDLVAYVQPDIVAPAVAAPIMQLPALFIKVEGKFNLTTNLDAFGLALKDFVAKIDLKPTDDQSFADLDAQVKYLKEAEALIKAQKLGAQGQVVSFDTMCKTADLLLEIASKARIAGENAVKAQKVAIKGKAISDAKALFADHVAGLEAEIAPIRLVVTQPDFITATKGLKGLKSLHAETNQTLTNAKIAADYAAKDIRAKLAWCKENAAGMSFLFPDLQQIIIKPMDDFTLTITSLLKEHKEHEAKKAAGILAKADADAAAKLEAGRRCIRAEEEAKVRAKLEAEAARLKFQQEEARIEKEEASKANAVGQSRSPVGLGSAFQQAVRHAYAQTDGTYAWPNSREGDMLREAKRENEQLRDALTELRDRIKDHPVYAELTEEEEENVGGDTAELSYLARIADFALGG